MEFRAQDSPWERALKLKVLEVYNSKLDARRERKDFIISRGLLHRRERKRTRDEREVHQALRPLARFHAQADHDALVQGVLNERRLRQRIEQLQAYRLNGVRSLAEGALFETERARRELAVAARREAVGLGPEPSAGPRDAALAPLPQSTLAAVTGTGAVAGTGVGDTDGAGVADSSADNADDASAATAAAAAVAAAAAGAVAAGGRAAKKARIAFTADGIVPAGSGATGTSTGGGSSSGGGAGDAAALLLGADVELTAAGPAPGSLPLSAITGFDVSLMEGSDLLSAAERTLCTELRLAPQHYTVIKERILRECVAQG